MKTKPLITVIICTYNTKQLTLECLARLNESIKFLGKTVEVILVENGNDGTGLIAKKEFSYIKLIDPRTNTGFAKGNNLAIKAMNKYSKYVLLLNSDVLVEKDTLKKSVEFMETHSNCDVLGPRLHYGDKTFQPSGGYLPTPVSVVTWIWGLDLIPVLNRMFRPVHPNHLDFFIENRQIGWVMGAYLFMKREVVNKTHGMDENFFMYMEEVEWCKRINDAGYEIWYTPTFEVTHLDKASSKKDPEKLRKIYKTEIQGIVYYLRKYYKKSLYWLLPLIKVGLVLRTVAFSLTGNNMRKTAYSETLREL